MSKGQTPQVVFKQDFHGQGMLITRTPEELVPGDYRVRTVSAVVDKIDFKPILRRYKAGGTSKREK